jgi:hypothetical protein
MIRWKEYKDMHIEGISPLGMIWIRFDRTGVARSVYTKFDSVVKHIIEEDWQKDRDGAQLWAEQLYSYYKLAKGIK